MKIKIIGCGSAGNHICFAFKKFANQITMTDTDINLFKRSKSLYLNRYNYWNKKINFNLESRDTDYYDAIIISTPPNTHLNLLKKNINRSNLFLIEKPLCSPKENIIKEFENLLKFYKKKKIFCGYNHRFFPSTKKFLEIFKEKTKLINNLSVNFKENTSGFLKAHYWMRSIEDSYLGSTKDGGGSLSEHSHALNLAQMFVPNLSNKDLISKKINYESKRKKYDVSAEIIFKRKKLLISICQNFLSSPIEKNIIATGKDFYLKLTYNHHLSNDHIIYIYKNSKKVFTFKKNRKDDFIYEAEYIHRVFKSKDKSNIIDSKSALSTMKIINKILY